MLRDGAAAEDESRSLATAGPMSQKVAGTLGGWHLCTSLDTELHVKHALRADIKRLGIYPSAHVKEELTSLPAPAQLVKIQPGAKLGRAMHTERLRKNNVIG